MFECVYAFRPYAHKGNCTNCYPVVHGTRATNSVFQSNSHPSIFSYGGCN